MSRSVAVVRLGFCLPIIIALAACDAVGTKPPYDPNVAATVNGNAISVQQIELALQQSGVASQDAKAAARLALDRLIEQELVLQKAQEQKLERDPEVIPLLDAAYRAALQRAYLERVARKVAEPTAEEIRSYYDSRPELFAKRRIYTYRVLAVPAAKQHWAALQTQAERTQTLESLIPWLRRQGLPFVASIATRAAEQIPTDALPRIARLRDGQTTVVSAAEGVEVVQLISSKLEPLTERQTRATVKQFLLNQRRQQRVAEEIKALHAAARVEKLGDFSQSSTAAAPAGLFAYQDDATERAASRSSSEQ